MREESCQLFAALHLPLPLPLCIIVIAPTSSVNWFSFRLFCLQLGSQQTRQLPYLLLFLLSHCAVSFIFPPCFCIFRLFSAIGWSGFRLTKPRMNASKPIRETRSRKKSRWRGERREEGWGMKRTDSRMDCSFGSSPSVPYN